MTTRTRSRSPRAIALGAAFLPLAGCASVGNAPAEPVTWPVGRYYIGSSVSYQARGGTQVDRFSADLTIDPEGTMTLDSSTGLCQDPPPSEMGADQARGRRTFLCGDARYELRPAGGAVLGDLFAAVEEDVVVTQCVRYANTPTGERVCVETRETVVQRPVVKWARLEVTR